MTAGKGEENRISEFSDMYVRATVAFLRKKGCHVPDECFPGIIRIANDAMELAVLVAIEPAVSRMISASMAYFDLKERIESGGGKIHDE